MSGDHTKNTQSLRCYNHCSRVFNPTTMTSMTLPTILVSLLFQPCFAGTNVHEKSRSDFCRLRFQTHGYSELLLLGRQIKSPGIPIYNSGDIPMM